MWTTSKADIYQDVNGKGEEYHQVDVVTVTRLNCTRLCKNELGMGLFTLTWITEHFPLEIRDVG
jgi:hypothetical protein